MSWDNKQVLASWQEDGKGLRGDARVIPASGIAFPPAGVVYPQGQLPAESVALSGPGGGSTPGAPPAFTVVDGGGSDSSGAQALITDGQFIFGGTAMYPGGMPSATTDQPGGTYALTVTDGQVIVAVLSIDSNRNLSALSFDNYDDEDSVPDNSTDTVYIPMAKVSVNDNFVTVKPGDQYLVGNITIDEYVVVVNGSPYYQYFQSTGIQPVAITS